MAECCQSDVFQGDLERLCREDSVLMRGKELLEVPGEFFLTNPLLSDAF